MIRFHPAIATTLALLLWVPIAGAEGFEWKSDTPEAQGMSSEKLKGLRDDLVTLNTHAFLVVRHDKIDG